MARPSEAELAPAGAFRTPLNGLSSSPAQISPVSSPKESGGGFLGFLDKIVNFGNLPFTPKNNQDRFGSGGFISDIGDIISTPQFAATSLIAGKNVGEGIKERYSPSKALNIENPVGAFALDAVLDPLNVVGGLGLVGKLGKASKLGKISQTSQRLEEVSNLGNTGLIQKGITGIKDVLSSVVNNPLVLENTRQARNLFNKTSSGRKIARGLDYIYNRSQVLEGGAVKNINKILAGVSDDIFSEALDFREGLISDASSKAKILANQLDSIFTPFADLAAKAKLEIRRPGKPAIPFQPRQGYVPHIIDIEKFKKNQGMVVAHLVDTGQMKIDDAEKLVEQIAEGRSVGSILKEIMPEDSPHLFSSLEFGRMLDLPREVLKRDKSLLAEYVSGASKRIAQAEAFGAYNQKLTPLFNKLGGEADLAETIKKVTLRELGIDKNDFKTEQMVAKFRMFNSLTKLGTAAISNLTQSVNTATSFGIGPTVRATMKDFLKRPESRDFALDSGVISEAAIRDLMGDSLGQASGITGKLTAPGFKQVEDFNRAIAANAGKNYIVDEFAKAINGSEKARLNLDKMGVDVVTALREGSLSEGDFIRAARKAVETTQFTVREIDLPPNWTGTYGKLIFQFKNFSFKQAQFLSREVINPAIHGNFVPLIRFTVLGTLAGELSGDIKSMITGRDRPEDPFERVAENILNVGGGGIPADLVRAAQNNRVSEWIVGPTGGDIEQFARGTVGGSPKELGKLAAKSVPIIGPRIKNTIFPPREARASENANIDTTSERSTITTLSGTKPFIQPKP